jgi:hypothetical protein
MDAKKELNRLIERHFDTMTSQQHDRVLDLWRDGVVNRKDIAAALALLKAEVERPDLTPLQRLHHTARQQQQQQRLTGHQMAAQKAGLDPHAPGIEKMTFAEMQAAVAAKRDAEYEVSRVKNMGHNHRHGMPVDRNGCAVRGGLKS